MKNSTKISFIFNQNVETNFCPDPMEQDQHLHTSCICTVRRHRHQCEMNDLARGGQRRRRAVQEGNSEGGWRHPRRTATEEDGVPEDGNSAGGDAEWCRRRSAPKQDGPGGG